MNAERGGRWPDDGEGRLKLAQAVFFHRIPPFVSLLPRQTVGGFNKGGRCQLTSLHGVATHELTFMGWTGIGKVKRDWEGL